MAYEIRPAKADDARLVARALMMGLFYTRESFSDGEIDEFLPFVLPADGAYSCRNTVIAYDTESGAPVAYLISMRGANYPCEVLVSIPENPEIRKTLDWFTPEQYYLDTLAVEKSERGKGIGTMLLNYGIERGRALGCKEVALTVEVDNAKAQKLYENLGFHFVKDVECYGTNYHLMVKKL